MIIQSSHILMQSNEIEIGSSISNSRIRPIEEPTPNSSQCNCQVSYLSLFLHSAKTWDYIGGIVTFISVIPAALYSGLWFDLLLAKYMPPIARAPLDMLAAFTAMIGKFALIRFYNKASFQNLSKVKWHESFFSRDFWKAKNLCNYIITISVSASFVFLGTLSLIYTAALARQYQTRSGDEFGQFITSLPVQVILASTRFFSNALSFSNIVPRSYHHCVEFFSNLFSPKQTQLHYLAKQQQLIIVSNKFVGQFNQLIHVLKTPGASDEDFNICYDALLSEIELILGHRQNRPINFIPAKVQIADLLLTPRIQNSDAASMLKTNMLSHVTHPYALENMPSSFLYNYYLASGLTLGIVGISAIGLSNFFEIALTLGLWLHLKQANIVLCAFTMIGISALALTTLNYRPYLLSRLQPKFKKSSIEIMQKRTYQLLNGLSILICLLGGTANAYASLVLAKQSIPIVAISFATPFFLELFGTITWSRADIETATLKGLENKCEFIEPLYKLVKESQSIDANLPSMNYDCRFWFSNSARNENHLAPAPKYADEFTEEIELRI